MRIPSIHSQSSAAPAFFGPKVDAEFHMHWVLHALTNMIYRARNIIRCTSINYLYNLRRCYSRRLQTLHFCQAYAEILFTYFKH